MGAPQVRVVGDGTRWTVYVDGKQLPVVSARLKLVAGEIPTVLLEVDDVEVEVLGELRAAVAARRPTRFGDARDEIVTLLEQGVSVQAISQRLILPRNDVLEVQAQLRRAEAERHEQIDTQHAERVAAQPAAVVELPAAAEPRPAQKPKAAQLPGSAGHVRQWARDAGLPCPDTGRIPQATTLAYFDAHPDLPRPAPAPVQSASTATIREWARGAGLNVPSRGTLSQAIIDAYDAAHREPAQVAS